MLCAFAPGQVSLRTARLEVKPRETAKEIVLRLGSERRTTVRVRDSFGPPDWDFMVLAVPDCRDRECAMVFHQKDGYDHRPFGQMVMSETGDRGDVVLPGLAQRPYRLLVMEGQTVHWEGSLSPYETLVPVTLADE